MCKINNFLERNVMKKFKITTILMIAISFAVVSEIGLLGR